MAIRKMRRHFGRHNAAGVLLGLAALGYVAFTLVVQAVLAHDITLVSARQSAILSLLQDDLRVDARATTGAAVSSAPEATATRAPTRNFDYFPDHYVNEATKPAEPIPTF